MTSRTTDTATPAAGALLKVIVKFAVGASLYAPAACRSRSNTLADVLPVFKSDHTSDTGLPVAPVGPVAPAPVSPVLPAPVAPVAPVLPAPVAPVAPVSPVPLVAPVAPVGA